MTDPAAKFDVPVEPVWYASSLDAAPPATPAVETPGPAPDDILPSKEQPPAVEPPTARPAADPAPAPLPRRWRTVHVVAAAVIALVIGLVIGRITSPSDGSSSTSSASRPSVTGVSPASQPAAGAPQSQTPPPASAAPATSATPAAVNGHAVLLNIPRHQGPLITDHFTVTGSRWVLGWAYDCTGQQGGTGAFSITVFDGSGGPSKDGGIDQQGAKGSSVVAYTSTGERYLSVATNCVWAIRVTT